MVVLRDHGFCVSIEANHIKDKKRAEEVAAIIRDRLSDLNEDIYVSVLEYELVSSKKE